jgi:hypothetical protein
MSIEIRLCFVCRKRGERRLLDYPWRIKPVHRSPNQLQRELNLPGRCLRGRNQPSVANRTSRGIKDIPIVEGRTEIRVVENIEKFRPELHIERVGDSLDAVVLE